VDNLVRKGLVTRVADPEDRRLVICTLSPEGQNTLNRLWTLGQFQMEKLLNGLSLEELKKADEVAQILLNNVMSTTSSTDDG
jgi:DNA-binding MarR family transcriptional regulator